jgi:hypothetical protein
MGGFGDEGIIDGEATGIFRPGGATESRVGGGRSSRKAVRLGVIDFVVFRANPETALSRSDRREQCRKPAVVECVEVTACWLKRADWASFSVKL